MEQVTNNVTIILLGTFGILFALSHARFIQRKLGRAFLADFISAFLFTTLFTPFAGACLTALEKAGKDTDTYVIMIIALMAFILPFHGYVSRRRKRKEKTKNIQINTNDFYTVADYDVFLGAVSCETKVPKETMKMLMPADLSDLRIAVGEEIMDKHVIMECINEYYGAEFTHFINDWENRWVILMCPEIKVNMERQG